MKHLKELSTKTNGFDLSRIGLGIMRLGADWQAGIDLSADALSNINNNPSAANGLISGRSL